MMSFKSLPLIALALALPACMGTENRGIESVHQPVVQRTDYVIDLTTNGYGLATGERERLDGWFRSIDLAYGDRVAVDDPSGSGAARADVQALLGRRGLALTGAAPVTAGAIAPGTARVVVSRAAASVKGCPDWSRPSSPDFTSSTMSNYGCASNAALASMVADPLDLVQGREGATAIDTMTASRAIKSYLETAPTGKQGLKNERTGKGN
ncbi:MAG: CpaD family pilus assembly protein [Proteobacteria bacterium]|nr:CpaD family pilus assembly protein [Pseudomonadota bacterium]